MEDAGVQVTSLGAWGRWDRKGQGSSVWAGAAWTVEA